VIAPAVKALAEARLYAILDLGYVAPAEAERVAIELLRGGVDLIQLRGKKQSVAELTSLTNELHGLTSEVGVPLIINDDVDLAAAIGADGVHLGEHDGGIDAARTRLGAAAIIGVSCYDSLDRARQLAAAGADYLAFGAFFPSPTKPLARRAGAGLLRDAKSLGLPLVAIGGITPDNAQPLIEAGADFVAAISGVFAAADPSAAARRYANLFTR